MKPLLDVLNGRIPEIPPVWLMRQAGRYLPEYRKVREEADSFLELCYTPELAAEVTLQPIRRFHFDAAIIFSDILVVPHALGQDLQYIEGVGPVLAPIENFYSLNLDRVEEHLNPIFQAIKIVKKELKNNVALIGFAGAPWTVAAYMIEGKTSKDFLKVKRFALTDPEKFRMLVDKLVDATVRYIKAQVNAGVEVIQIFDSWAGILTPQQFHDWVIEPTQRIVSAVKITYPSIPIIGFPKGAGTQIVDYVERIGINAIGLDYMTSRSWIHNTLNIGLPVQGNLDPIILAFSKKHTVSETRSMIEDFSGRPHIVNLGHGILPETPIDHVHAMIEVVRRV